MLISYQTIMMAFWFVWSRGADGSLIVKEINHFLCIVSIQSRFRIECDHNAWEQINISNLCNPIAIPPTIVAVSPNRCYRYYDRLLRMSFMSTDRVRTVWAVWDCSSVRLDVNAQSNLDSSNLASQIDFGIGWHVARKSNLWNSFSCRTHHSL
jgi:hypothetical protein